MNFLFESTFDYEIRMYSLFDVPVFRLFFYILEERLEVFIFYFISSVLNTFLQDCECIRVYSILKIKTTFVYYVETSSYLIYIQVPLDFNIEDFSHMSKVLCLVYP